MVMTIAINALVGQSIALATSLYDAVPCKNQQNQRGDKINPWEGNKTIEIEERNKDEN